MFEIGDIVYHRISREKGIICKVKQRIRKDDKNIDLNIYEVSTGFGQVVEVHGCEIKLLKIKGEK